MFEKAALISITRATKLSPDSEAYGRSSLRWFMCFFDAPDLQPTEIGVISWATDLQRVQPVGTSGF